MSIVVSYKKQTIFFILLILIVIFSLEILVRIYDPTLNLCNFENTSISPEVKNMLCTEHNLLNFDLEEGKITTEKKLSTVRINNLGLRGEDINPKESSTYRIVTIGGSTTFGTGVSDNETYPSILESLFHEKGFENIEVINGGLGGAWSFQEVILIQNKILDLEPDLIIVYDGWNDAMKSDLEKEVIPDSRGDKVSTDVFLYSGNIITHNLQNVHFLKTMNRLINYDNNLLNYHNRSIVTYDYSNSDQKILEWENRWSQLCDEVKGDVKFIITIQPMVGTGEKKLTPTESIWATRYDNVGINAQLEKYVEKLPNIKKHCDEIADFRNIFDNTTSTIYTDNGHVAENGNRIIAKEVYKKIFPLISDDLSK